MRVVVVPSTLALLPEYAGDEHHARHWSPGIARRGGRRPAIDDTMSTVCRVSTTSWTR